MSAQQHPSEQIQRGKSTFAGNPFANHKTPVLLRVLMKKLRRENLKDTVDPAGRPGEQFAAGDVNLDHGKASGAANALTFHTFGQNKKED